MPTPGPSADQSVARAGRVVIRSSAPHGNDLLQWEAYAGAPSEGAARVLAHPRAARASRALAANMLVSLESDRAFASICKDAGRYVAAMTALYLHFDSGLTLPKLKDMCIASGFLSRGRARAVLRALQQLKYLESDASPAAVGARRYVPTSGFLNAWCGHLRAALDAACLIEPAAASVRDRLDDLTTAAVFIRLQSTGLLRGVAGNPSTPMPALMRVIMDHDAGFQLTWHLLSANAADDEFPPTAAMHLPIAGLARRFNVSRVHVRRMLGAAAREGVLEADASGAVRFADGGRGEIRFLYAAQLAQLLASAAGTLRATHATE
jgi:hypothetical protein